MHLRFSRLLTRVAAGVCAAGLISTPLLAGSASASAASVRLMVRAVIAHDSVAGIGTSPMGVAVDAALHRAYVVNFTSSTVSVIDTTRNVVSTVITRGMGLGPSRIAIDGLSHQAFVSNYDDTVSVIDTSTNRVTHTIAHDPTTGIGSDPHGIGIDEGGRQAYVVNYADGSVSVINIVTDEVKTVITDGIAKHPDSVAVDSELHRAYVTDYIAGTVSVIDTTTNTVSTTIEHDLASGIGTGPRDVGVDDLTHRAFVANADSNTVSVIDTTTDAVISVLPFDARSGVGDEPFGVAIDAANHRAYVTNTQDGTVSVIDTVALTVTQVLQHDSAAGIGTDPWSVAVDPDAGWIYVTNASDGTVSVIGDSVARIGGADRYAVSAAVSADTFDPGVPAAFIASGENFPDALSAAAAAGSESSPVLLTTRDELPDAVATELARLKPRKIVVMGGTNSISASVQTALGAYSTSVTRIDGADRYAVSAALSARVYTPGVPVAYIASGQTFPDALSGTAVAGRFHGPVLLVTKDGVPAPVQAELARLKPGKVVVLGGHDSISGATLDSIAAYTPAGSPVTRLTGADRYATSAAISADTFPADTPMVYVASGENFPDALAGSVAAIVNGSPVLLVTRDSIPDSVKTELNRLNPVKIIVLGGPNTVADNVLAQLAITY
jgi:YVTN family beta-propeller protein